MLCLVTCGNVRLPSVGSFEIHHQRMGSMKPGPCRPSFSVHPLKQHSPPGPYIESLVEGIGCRVLPRKFYFYQVPKCFKRRQNPLGCMPPRVPVNKEQGQGPGWLTQIYAALLGNHQSALQASISATKDLEGNSHRHLGPGTRYCQTE